MLKNKYVMIVLLLQVLNFLDCSISASDFDYDQYNNQKLLLKRGFMNEENSENVILRVRQSGANAKVLLLLSLYSSQIIKKSVKLQTWKTEYFNRILNCLDGMTLMEVETCRDLQGLQMFLNKKENIEEIPEEISESATNLMLQDMQPRPTGSWGDQILRSKRVVRGRIFSQYF